MNPQNVVDVHLEETDQSWLVWRRRDRTMLLLPAHTDMKNLGRQVLQALLPKRPEELGWHPWRDDAVPSTWNSSARAIVFRRDNRVVVGTPFGPGGSAPILVILGDQPNHGALGRAVAEQAMSLRA